MFAGNFAPRSWAFCDGQLLAVSQNDALFSLVGTTYGGDGRTTFGLPDLRGRAAVHQGQGPGLSSYPLGQKSGVERVTLTASQMPSHSHGATATVKGTNARGNSETPEGNTWAKRTFDRDYSTNPPDVVMQAGTVEVTVDEAPGGGQSHENRPPSLGINHIIALFGVYPSRQ
jgi:microcystin-dependent protein